MVRIRHLVDKIKDKAQDLSEWEMRNFDKIHELRKFFAGEENGLGRYTIEIPLNLNFDQKDNHGKFCRLTFKDKNVKIYRSEFKPHLESGLFDGTLSFDLKKKDSYYKVVSMSCGRSVNKKITNGFARSFRFPTIQLWNNSVSVLNNPDAPEDFKNATRQAKEDLKYLLENLDVQAQPDLWDELLLFACMMHSDCEGFSADYLIQKISEPVDFAGHWKTLERFAFEAGYFIGRCESESQKKVFGWCCDFTSDVSTNKFKLQMLSIALWKSEDLLSKINFETMKKLLDLVQPAIENELVNLKAAEKKPSNRKLNNLRSYLELLFALVRSRKLGGNYIQIFSPFSKQVQNLVKNIEEIFRWLNSFTPQVNLFSRQIKFTGDLESTENQFLEYLLLYLDGENSSAMPKIESVFEATESEEDDDKDEE